jgi:hypothetical protein
MLLFIQETFGESGSNREHLNVAKLARASESTSPIRRSCRPAGTNSCWSEALQFIE